MLAACVTMGHTPGAPHHQVTLTLTLTLTPTRTLTYVTMGRQVRVVMKGAVAADRIVRDFTLVEYLSLPQPRTSHPEAALARLIAGHGHSLDPSRHATEDSPEGRHAFIKQLIASCEEPANAIDIHHVHSIDWWCGKISDAGTQLRTDNNRTNRRASLVLPQRSWKEATNRRPSSDAVAEGSPKGKAGVLGALTRALSRRLGGVSSDE